MPMLCFAEHRHNKAVIYVKAAQNFLAVHARAVMLLPMSTVPNCITY